jgi:lipopolysaccharide export LptBFGC system permease protein LptF
MSELFEAFMVILFGISWPMNIVKSVRSKTAKGKSLAFTILILVGYICGIISKLVSPKGLTYVFVFYILNLVMVTVDLILYFRNRKLDEKRDAEVSKKLK